MRESRTHRSRSLYLSLSFPLQERPQIADPLQLLPCRRIRESHDDYMLSVCYTTLLRRQLRSLLR